jgi:hypothetical protein
MIKYFILIILFVYSSLSFCQEKIKRFDNFIGYQARLIDLMPSEISYLCINKKKGFSFAVRGGFGNGEKNKLSSTGISFVGNNFSINQTFNAFFIKPGLLFATVRKKRYATYILLNYNLVHSSEKLRIENDDQLYGKYIIEYRHEKFYHSVEFENHIQFKLSPKIYYGVGGILGLKLNNTIPFADIFPYLSKASTYTPSQGSGNSVYINYSISLMFKL